MLLSQVTPRSPTVSRLNHGEELQVGAPEELQVGAKEHTPRGRPPPQPSPRREREPERENGSVAG